MPTHNLTKPISLLREVGYDVPFLNTDQSDPDSNGILDLGLLLGSGAFIIFVIVVISGTLVLRSRRRLRRYEKPADYSKEYLEQARRMAEEEGLDDD